MKNNFDTQKAKIRARLREGLGISQLEALNDYGCFRLSAVIFRLKQEGEQIESYWETWINAAGETKRFKVYYASGANLYAIRRRYLQK